MTQLIRRFQARRNTTVPAATPKRLRDRLPAPPQAVAPLDAAMQRAFRLTMASLRQLKAA